MEIYSRDDGIDSLQQRTKKMVSTTTIVLCFLGILCSFAVITRINFTTISYEKRNEIEYRIEQCDPEVCGQQCYNTYYMNAWCENSLCYCDNDCERHRRLYPWDDVMSACAYLCNYKHGPCTGSGCANDSYWTNDTQAHYDLYWNTTIWLLEANNTRWNVEHFFFNSSVCLCYDNGTEEEPTTETPSPSDWFIGDPDHSSEEHSESSSKGGASGSASGSTSSESNTNCSSSNESEMNQHGRSTVSRESDDGSDKMAESSEGETSTSRYDVHGSEQSSELSDHKSNGLDASQGSSPDENQSSEGSIDNAPLD